MGELLTRVPRRTLLWVGVAAAIAIAIAVWRVENNASASSNALLPTVRVTRADIVVSVGGVGRIVEKNGSSPITIPGGSTSGSGAVGNTTTAPADAVFPHSTGHIGRLFVQP